MLDDQIEVSIAAASDTILSNPSQRQTLSYDSSIHKWTNATLPDASTTAKGLLQLSGDLAGSASSPSVVFANDTLHVAKSGDSMTGVLNIQVPSGTSAIAISTPTPVSDNVYTSLNGRARFGYSGTNGSVYIDDNSTGKAIQFNANSAQVLRLNGTSGNNGANYTIINNGAAGAGVTLTAGGSDANIPISITPKGTGTTILKNIAIPSGASNGYVLTSDASGNASWQASQGGSGSALVLPKVVTGSYTLAAGDAGTAVEIDSTGAATVTVPPASMVAFAIGTIIEVCQRGAGQVTVSPGAGVTIRTAASGALRAQYSVATLRLSTTDEWILAGDLA